MKKTFGLTHTSSGSSVDIPISENLKKFPRVAKIMNVCYRTLADLINLLDDRERLSEESFGRIDKLIKKQIDVLNNCLADVFRDDVEMDRFNRFEQYYQTVRYDSMEYLMSKIDASCYDINFCLKEKFNALSDTIYLIDRYPFSKRYLKEFYDQMKDIKNILESKKYQDQMTILQYQDRRKKYKSASAYVKNIRSGK